MIKLSKLTSSDFETFKSWINSEEELFQFAGTMFTYPLTDDQLTKYINDPQRKAFKAIQEPSQEIIGHVELNLENKTPRLSRLIIGNKAYRGKKYGKKIILKLLEMAFIKYDTPFVDVNVYDWNITAMKSYQSVGFNITPEEGYHHELDFKVWTAINMNVSKERWLAKNHLFIKKGKLHKCVNFSPITHEIKKKVKTWKMELSKLSTNTITSRLNPEKRSIKQILGHLIDSASNNHQRIVRLQYSKELDFPDYNQNDEQWVQLQNYQNANWKNMLQLWKSYNLHLINVITSVDQSKLNNSWQNFEGNTSTLQQMIEGYYDHIDLHLNEIQHLINTTE